MTPQDFSTHSSTGESVRKTLSERLRELKVAYNVDADMLEEAANHIDFLEKNVREWGPKFEQFEKRYQVLEATVTRYKTALESLKETKHRHCHCGDSCNMDDGEFEETSDWASEGVCKCGLVRRMKIIRTALQQEAE